MPGPSPGQSRERQRDGPPDGRTEVLSPVPRARDQRLRTSNNRPVTATSNPNISMPRSPRVGTTGKGVGVLVAVGVEVFVGVFVGVIVGVMVAVFVGVIVGVMVAVFVAVPVGVVVAVLVGTTAVLVAVTVTVCVGTTAVLVAVTVTVCVGATTVLVAVTVTVCVGATTVLVGVTVTVDVGVACARATRLPARTATNARRTMRAREFVTRSPFRIVFVIIPQEPLQESCAPRG